MLAAILIALWKAGILRGTSPRFALLGISTWKLFRWMLERDLGTVTLDPDY